MKKDYATAILLNVFFPGAGYVYAGRALLGGCVLLVAIVCGILVAQGMTGASSVLGLLSVVGAADGYLTVKRWNDAIDAVKAEMARKCPHCAEQIQPDAKICRFCQRDVA